MAQSSRAGTGMTLLWAALAINGVNVVLGWYRLAFRLDRFPLIPALVFVFWLFLTSEISIGHTWARIVYVAFIVVELLRKIGVSLLPTLPSWLIEPAGASSTLALAALVLQVIGIAMLLMGTPRQRGS
jgi:hypothetical protein